MGLEFVPYILEEPPPTRCDYCGGLGFNQGRCDGCGAPHPIRRRPACPAFIGGVIEIHDPSLSRPGPANIGFGGTSAVDLVVVGVLSFVVVGCLVGYLWLLVA